jgi:hypothetical protein
MIDTTSLFLHVLAAVGILGGAGAQVLVGHHVRQARTTADVVTWGQFTRTLGVVIAASAAVALLTGGHLAGAVWTTETTSGFSYPFISLGAAALLLLVPIGPMVGGRRLRRLIESAATSGREDVSAELHDASNSPVLWGAVHSLVGVALGLVAVMVYKPGWVTTAALLVTTFAFGWLVGAALGRRGTS